jgi:hypothetical protein
MDVDGSSLAAAALYDMKNEQLQLANAALQQQTTSTTNKQQETSVSTTTDQSVTTTSEGQQFGEGGKIKILFFIIKMICLLKKWDRKFHLNLVNFYYIKDIFLIYFIFLFGKYIQKLFYSNMILSLLILK